MRAHPTRTTPTLLALSLAALVSFTSAFAAPSIALTLLHVSTVTKNGVRSEVLTPTDAAARVHPGETLLQRATLHTDSAIHNASVTIPVPVNTHYVPGSASGPAGLNVEFSADHGQTFSAVPMKTVTVTENGKAVSRLVPIPESEYSAVRWTTRSLPAGADLTVTARVSVN